MAIVLDARIPEGSIEQKWDRCRFEMKLVNPANRRKHTVLVVGSGLVGAAAAATLGEQGYHVQCFSFHDTPRRAHSIATTYAARTMRWSAVILVLFVVYHLLHLTAGVVGFPPGEFRDLSVYHNVVAGFSVWYVSLFYIVAMACLCLHLDHGVWSLLQTLGWNNARTTPALHVLSRGVALVVFLGFISVPVAVVAGWIR